MSEEMKRIQQTKDAQQRRDASRSTNLTGEQVFMRSCNTCHPQGKAGLGPSLEQLAEHYPEDVALKLLIRKGKGIMPGQPASVLNGEELDNLVDYLRQL
jgi:mono/diheme cytochrome c family protein